jgi:pseudaminic acid cytidylyltransferase
MSYSIMAARESGLFDRIIVSTDDPNIAWCADHYGAEVHHRDPAYANDITGTQEVIAECLRNIQAEDYDLVCCLYATSPLMDVRDLCRGHMLITGWDGCYADYVMSVGYPPLSDAGQFYWGLAFNFLHGTPLIGTHTRMVHVDPDRVCDINTMEDWAQAEKLYEGIRK